MDQNSKMLPTIHRKSSQKLKALPLDLRSKKKDRTEHQNAKKSKPGGIGFFGLKALEILGSNLNALQSSDVWSGNLGIRHPTLLIAIYSEDDRKLFDDAAARENLRLSRMKLSKEKK